MKKDYVYLLIALIIVIVTSCTVPDPRLPEEPKVVEEVQKVVHEVKPTVAEPKKEEVEEPEEVVEEAPDESEETYIEEEVIVYEEDFEEESQESEEPILEEPIEESYSPGLTYLGEWRITAYEWTGNPCANGCYPTEGYTVACNDLPLGTEVYIEGVGYRTVEDRGGGGSGWIDIYLGDVSACYQWGVQYREVYLVG